MSYRWLVHTSYLANNPHSLVLRQHYAKVMIPLLLEGKRIINIDESSVPFMDYRRFKWAVRGTKNTFARKELTPKVNMIVALDTIGRVYVSLTQVNTDSEVMISFLSRLATVLTSEDRDWRRNTVWLLDGARYHTSADTRKILKQIGVNFVISAPYSYDTAPVELYLAYYKQVQTNPNNEKTGKRYVLAFILTCVGALG